MKELNSRISSRRATPRDLLSLRSSLKVIPDLKEKINSVGLDKLSEKFHDLSELKQLLEISLNEELSNNIGSGQIFQDGYNSELDDYMQAKYSAKNWLDNYQEKEKSRTGINSLKVGFNNVFGYYIDITRAHSDKVPEEYQRRQSLRNSERYITPELKEFEEKILGAEEKISFIEQKLFDDLLSSCLKEWKSISDIAELIAFLDVLICFSNYAKANNYVKPQFEETQILEIIQGRHPVIEKNLETGGTFYS